MKSRNAIALLLLAGWPISFVCAADPNSPAPQLDAFRKPALLGRFDANRDARLDGNELQAMRAQFGGVTVPMLPVEPARYGKAAGDHTAAEREQNSSRFDEQLDNTPDDNRITDHGALLGRVLFYDTQLSRTNTVSCGSCHEQRRGFADPRRFSIGHAGGKTRRNAMGLANLRYSNVGGACPGFFWDERAVTLEDQVLMPIQDPIEMGMDLKQLESKLQSLPYYPPLFDAAFGSPAVSRDRVAKAVAQFLRSMVSRDSRFDRAARDTQSQNYATNFPTFTAKENLGKSLFINGVDQIGEIGCAHCHVPPTFNMPKSFNNGLDARYQDPGLGGRDVPNNDPFTPSNNGKFKAPSLRNIAVTAPYMHDGRFATLEQVIEHYSSGVHPHENVGLAFSSRSDAHSKTAGFALNREQQAALLAFLKTLTDETFISDPRFADPFPQSPNP